MYQDVKKFSCCNLKIDFKKSFLYIVSCNHLIVTIIELLYLSRVSFCISIMEDTRMQLTYIYQLFYSIATVKDNFLYSV